jgi:hypothetical protein
MHSADLQTQKLCIWSGLLWGLLFFAALIMIGQFPPPSPLASGEDILALMQSRIGLAKAAIPIGILGAGLAIPFNALIAGHIYRVESENNTMPLLTITSFGGGMGNIVFFFMVFLWWAGILYRPDTSPEVAIMVNDRIWLLIVMGFSAPALQMICIAMAGFRDQSASPVFPRWYNFLMLWIAFGTCTGCIAIFFFEGPFSWQGVISFWIPASAFCLWLLTLCYFYYKHILAKQSA